MKLYDYMPVSKLVEELEIRDKQILELEEYNKDLQPYMRTLEAIHVPIGLCPVCGKYIIVQGYVCFGCGYDQTEKTL